MAKLYTCLKRAIIILLILIFITLLTLGGICLLNYQNGISAMNEQSFIAARLHFDKIPFAEKLLPNEYKYISAGVLMEEGEYIESLNAFRELDTPVPVTITDTLISKIYTAGQTAYRDDDLDTAIEHFKAIRTYKRSADYLRLISCKENPYSSSVRNKYSSLVELIGFEDAGEIIIQTKGFATRFLKGRWEDGEKNNPHYFELDNENRTTYNLPHNNSGGYYYLTDGVYSVGETEASAIKYFGFSIIDEDTISVYCYKDGSTYKLYRQ